MIPTVVDTVLRAMAEAFPDRVAAAHHGTYGVHSFHGVSPATGESFFHLDTLCGGWGGSAGMDGYGPSRSNVHGDTSDVPVEMQEAFHPYRFESYALRPDSGGPGEFRGGVGIVKTYRITGPCRINLKIERTKCPPWGLLGGGEGKTAEVEIRRAAGEIAAGEIIGKLAGDVSDTVQGRSCSRCRGSGGDSLGRGRRLRPGLEARPHNSGARPCHRLRFARCGAARLWRGDR